MTEQDPQTPVPASTSAGHSDSRAASGNADPHVTLLATPVASLIRRSPITLPPDASIREAAQLMRDKHASSVLIV